MIWTKAKLGMSMLILAESVFFFMLILAFVYFRAESLKTATATLHPAATSIFTVCLLASGFTLWRGWLAPTMALGVIFLLGQGREYVALLQSGVTMSQGLFGTTFFTIAWIHAIHAVLGLILMGLASAGRLAVPVIAMFWYFVTGAWVVVFAVVYLWTFL
jgi:heme/copper-type cytochrome/quinol oxidase subunit 3